MPKHEDQKSKIVFVEKSNSHVSTKGIADSGATDHNISTIRPTDEVFEVSTPTYVQTANGVVATKKRVRRFCSALNEYLTALHLPFAPDLVSIGKLVRDGWSFIWDQTGAFLKKSDRVVKCEDSDLPTFDLDGTAFVLCRGERGMCQGCRKMCVVHSDFTHLGPSKFCDTCRISKIREKPHCKVDKEAKEKTLEGIKEYRKEVGYLQKISIDTFGPAVKTYQEHVYGTLALDKHETAQTQPGWWRAAFELMPAKPVAAVRRPSRLKSNISRTPSRRPSRLKSNISRTPSGCRAESPVLISNFENSSNLLRRVAFSENF